jgi:RHS repeat-associated protein
MARVNPFRFSTKYQDEETDLVYHGHRYYTSTTGRWLTGDPIGELGSLNLLGFCDGDPVNAIDPVGLNPESWTWTDNGGTADPTGETDEGVLYHQLLGVATVYEFGKCWRIDTAGTGAVNWRYSSEKVRKHEQKHAADRKAQWEAYKKAAVAFEEKIYTKAAADCLQGVIEVTMLKFHQLAGDLAAAEWDCRDYPKKNPNRQKRCAEAEALRPVVAAVKKKVSAEIEACSKK